MSRISKPKSVEWKETNLWSYTPKYEYSRPVANRYLAVWDKAKHWKRAIHYASQLSAPNLICIIYLLGDLPLDKVRAYLDSEPGNLMAVFCDGLQPYIDRCEWIVEELAKASKVWNMRDKESALACLRDEDAKYRDAVARNPDLLNDVSGAWDPVKTAIEAIEKEPVYQNEFAEKWNAGLCAIGCYEGAIPGEQEQHNAALFEIAKRVYPYGIEASGNTNRKAYQKTRRKNYALSGLGGNPEFGITINDLGQDYRFDIAMYDAREYSLSNCWQGMPLGIYSDVDDLSAQTGIKAEAVWRSLTGRTSSIKYGDTRVFFTKVVKPEDIPLKYAKDAYEYANRKILDQGYIQWMDLKATFSNPPYGFYSNHWYCYLMGVALKRYTNGKFFLMYGYHADSANGDSIAHCIASDEMSLRRLVADKIAIYKQTTEQMQFIRQFCKLFKIKRRRDTFQDAQSQARTWCERNIHYGGLSQVDDTLYRLVYGSPYGEVSDAIKYGYEKDYDYIRDHFDELQDKLVRADDRFRVELAERYGQERADYFCECQDKLNVAWAWLWDKEAWERFTKVFMEEHIDCCECGKPIYKQDYSENHTYKALACQSDKHMSTFHYFISAKDLIAVQKKLFGRSVRNFMCFDCLLEEMECTPEEIFDKIKAFKEEGCALFS